MVTTRAMYSPKPALPVKDYKNEEVEKQAQRLSDEEDDMEEIIEMEDDLVADPDFEVETQVNRMRKRSSTMNCSVIVNVGDMDTTNHNRDKISPSANNDEPAAKKRRPGFFTENEKPMKPSQALAVAKEKVTGVQDKVLSILNRQNNYEHQENVWRPAVFKVPTINNRRRETFPVAPSKEVLKSVAQNSNTVPLRRVVLMRKGENRGVSSSPRMIGTPVRGGVIPQSARQFNIVPPRQRVVGPVFQQAPVQFPVPPAAAAPPQLLLPVRSYTKEAASVVNEMKCVHKKEENRVAWAKVNKRCKVGAILDINKLHNLGYYTPRSFTALQLVLVQDLINSAKVPRHAFQLLKGVENGPHLKVMVDNDGEILTKKMPIFLSKLSMFLYVREFLVTLKCCPNLVISSDRECDACLPNCNENALNDDVTEIVGEKVTEVHNEFDQLQKKGARLLSVAQTAEVYRRRLGDHVAKLIINNEIDSSILQYIDVETLRGQMRISEALALRIVSIAMELRAQSHESILPEFNQRRLG